VVAGLGGMAWEGRRGKGAKIKGDLMKYVWGERKERDVEC